jgi:hypothetical protein
MEASSLITLKITPRNLNKIVGRFINSVSAVLYLDTVHVSRIL